MIWMDSSVSPTHGEQEQSVWTGHFGCTCYHPLFVFNQFGDLERCALRAGNVHSADGWEQVLKPVVARYRGTVRRIAFRGDAAFAQPNMYEFLEAEGIDYAIRLPANQVLQERIGDLLRRPVGRPAHYVQRFYRSFRYQAASWSRPRRVVAKVEWHHGELFPRVGFHNKRGRCEQWIKEGKAAIKWTRLSCRSFDANAVRLQLHALAYNLGNFLRTLATPEPIRGRSRVCARSSSRSARRWSATAGTLPSKWRRSPSPAMCLRTSCGWSPRCARRRLRRRQYERPAKRAGKSAGDLSPFDLAVRIPAARRPDAGAISHRTGGSTRPPPGKTGGIIR